MRTCRLAFSKKGVLLIITAVVLIIIGIDLFLLYNKSKPAFSMEPPDAEIKLLGIEPDGSGTIFDTKGKKILDNVLTGYPSYFNQGSGVPFKQFFFGLKRCDITGLFCPFSQKEIIV